MTGRVQKNLEYWEHTRDEYQAAHGQTLTQTAKAWGIWRILEADLNVLGDLEGKNVLELGCGAAQWSLALSDAGPDLRS